MRIGLDAHTLGSKVGGNETYIKSLAQALGKVDTANLYSLYVTSENGHTDAFSKLRNFSVRTLRPKNPLIRIPFSTPMALSQDKMDLMLLQYVAPPLCPAPYVLVIHDISYERYPEYFKPLERMRLKATTPFSARRAAAIVTGSEYSKKDLVRFYGLPDEKIHVIQYGKSEAFKPVRDENALKAIRQKYVLPDSFILYVGNIQPRKNLPRLLEAFKRLKLEKKIHEKLVITGNKAWLYTDVFEFIRREGLESQIIITGYVPDEDLPSLYSAAAVAVYPSLFEGFGFPVLEAMSCGTPVITSNTSSLPEVAGDAALLIDPKNVEEIAEAILKLLTQPEKRAELIEKGFKQAERFDWNKTALKTLKLFENIHHNKKGDR